MTSTATHPGRAAWDVVGLGANSVDYVNLLPASPQPQGEFAKMWIREQTITCGGQMATALATCSQPSAQRRLSRGKNLFYFTPDR